MDHNEQIQRDVKALAGKLEEDPFAGGGVMMGPAAPWTPEEIATAERVREYNRAEVEKALSGIGSQTARKVKEYLGM